MDMANLQGGAAKQSGGSLDVTDASEGAPVKLRKTVFGEPFSQVFKLLEDTKVMGPGPIRPLGARKDSKRQDVPEGTYCSLLGLPLDPEFFGILETAERRADWYLETAGTTGGWAASDQGPDISTIPALLKSKRATAIKTWALKYSTDHEQLCNMGMTVEQAKVHFADTGTAVPRHVDRSELIKRLCSARKDAQIESSPPGIDLSELKEQTAEEGRKRMAHPLFTRELRKQ